MASILHTNLLRDTTAYTVLTDNSLANYPFENCYDGISSTQVGFTGSNQEIILDFGSAISIDAIGIARHNLATTGTTFNLDASSDNITYSSITTITPTSDVVILKEFNTSSYRYWKFKVSPTGTLYIGDIFIGERLDLERGQKGGFVKPLFADDDQVVPNVTRGGNILSITSYLMPKNVSFELYYYTASFFSEWPAICAEMKTHPIYILWKDGEQPFYCWPKGSVASPSYADGIVGRYNAKLDMQGFTY